MDAKVLEMATAAKACARRLASLDTKTKNNALNAMAEALASNQTIVLEANATDIEHGRSKGLSDTLLDRLTLTQARIAAISEGIRQIVALPDPIGQILEGNRRPNGLEIRKVRVPLGVIGIIYESRPNVTVDSAALCLKSGNAVLLRGGSEAIHTNRVLARLCAEAVEAVGIPQNAIQLIGSTDREAARTLMQAEGFVDVLIPRGGESLKKTVLENARVPVLASLGGNCHTFVDASANLEMAAKIALNAKISRPSVCNAMETLLVHKSIAHCLLPDLCLRYREAGVEVRGCERTCQLVPNITLATESDWETEYLNLTLAVRIVDSFDMALDHIAQYGTGHSEAIVTADLNSAHRFTSEVDAACVYVNASTRFTDGFEMGLGAEVGISTQKLHVRGPIGLEGLTTYKMILQGNGQTR